VRFRDVHEPALDFQEYIEDLHRQATGGEDDEPHDPSTLIHGATVLRQHRTTQLSTSPAQQMAESVLSVLGLGRALGYRTG